MLSGNPGYLRQIVEEELCCAIRSSYQEDEKESEMVDMSDPQQAQSVVLQDTDDSGMIGTQKWAV